MAEPNAPPSINPADTGTLAGTMRVLFEKMVQGLDDMLPAQVIAVDPDRRYVSVQPMIMLGTTDGRKIRRAQIARIPVLNIGGGGFLLSFPIEPGDLGWIKASDRDYSLFMQGFTEEWPNTRRMHSFQDSVFIPHVMRPWTLDGDDIDSAVLQSADGTVRIAISPANVTITAPTVIIDTTTMQVLGDIEASGDVTASGISLMTHVHSGVTAGGANTGEPVT